MEREIKKSVLIVLSMALSLMGGPMAISAPAPRYDVVDLGPMAREGWSLDLSINGKGEACGTETEDDRHVAVFWDVRHVRHVVPPVAGLPNTKAIGLDGEGAVVVLATRRSIDDNSRGPGHLYTWRNGRVRPVFTPDRDDVTVGGVNENGVVIASIEPIRSDAEPNTAHKNRRVFLYGIRSGRMRWLPKFPAIEITALNNQLDAAGSVYAPEVWSVYRACLVRAGRAKQQFVSANSSDAGGINDRGQVIGNDVGVEQSYAFVWQGGKKTMITSKAGLTYAGDINNRGQVVGSANATGTWDGPWTAFLWERGAKTHDLNTLIPPGTHWKLGFAVGINDAGQIIGHGELSGEGHAYLLTPKASRGVK